MFKFDESIIINKVGCKSDERVQVKYSLIGTINYPYDNHFTSSTKDPKIYGQTLNGWFLHDSALNDGKLVPREGFTELIQEKPFAFFYKIDLN